MEYFYKCFNRVIKLVLSQPKSKELDFWLQRFCPNIEILEKGSKFDFVIDCIENKKYDYILNNNKIILYGIFDKYESFMAKFITQVFQRLIIEDGILIFPAACVKDKSNCLLIIGDFWQGKTSTALNICKLHNLELISDNYVAIKDSKVIGATKYVSKRVENKDSNDKSLLIVNNRYFYNNSYYESFYNLEIKGFLLPFINNSDNNLHLISKEESKWYLYQKMIRLLSGESVLFNGNLPSPSFLNKENSIMILNLVNEFVNNLDITYVSSGMDVIVTKAIEILK